MNDRIDPDRIAESLAVERWAETIHESWRGDDRLCVTCRKDIPDASRARSIRGGLRCRDCSLIKRRGTWASNTPARQRAQYTARRSKGLCVRCAAPALEGRSMCQACCEVLRARRRNK